VKTVAESSKGKEKAQPKNFVVLSDSGDAGPGYGNHVSSLFSAIPLLAPEGKSKSWHFGLVSNLFCRLKIFVAALCRWYIRMCSEILNDGAGS
jgi:hypothetical protein